MSNFSVSERGVYAEQAKELMHGAYDLHTHTEPSAFNRALNDWELVREAEAYGMAGVMIKAHYGCTAARAMLVNQLGNSRAMAYGGGVLNWPVGGLNPYAVENSLKMGGIIVWMPTRDAAHCLSFGEMPGDFFERPGITVLDKNGKLVSAVYEIMDVVKKYGAYLATGHLSMEESLLLCRAGRERKVNMILTHPEWSRTIIPGTVQAEMASMGVVIEKNWINIAEKSVSAEQMAKNIRTIGPVHVYLATDRGQRNFEHPARGMQMFIETLLEQGFREREITAMACSVPSRIANRQSFFCG